MIERDYFTDFEILRDPYAYFAALRSEAPVFQPPGRDFLVVTGFEEAVQVLRDGDAFSSVIALQSAGAPLPFTPSGSDVTHQIEGSRADFAGPELVVNMDDDAHLNLRSLINTLFTPSRLKANEKFIREYSDELVREAVSAGHVELVRKVATPFVTLVIADLLGVPAEDRDEFIRIIENAPPPGDLDGPQSMEHPDHPFVQMGSYFVGYVQDRIANPRDDILTELATASFSDGSRPDMMGIVKLAMFMFGAGQDTSAKLLGNAMRYLAEDHALQQRLREDHSLIPALIEEMLRLEGSAKQTARLARKDTEVGGVPIPAGTKVLIALAAANRDPSRWSDGAALELNRPKIKEHVGFGRGKHVCPGAPLARAEVRIILEKFLESTSLITFDEGVHGTPDARVLDYEASFIIRGLSELHLKLTPAADFVSAEPPVRTEASAPAAAPSGEPAFSTAKTKLGDLLKHPGAKALLDKHFPGVSTDKRIMLGKGMTLRRVQSFAPDMFTDEALAAYDAGLATLDS